jgi:redox-sensitive bicupin YhaK (pirin superfamily)
MSIVKYPAGERGENDAGWLSSRFSFSFANYYDPNRMGFGTLRVLNDDVIAAGNGFGMHPHANMEIITIMTGGVLEHKDSAGNGGLLYPGDVQVMSAGSGIAHSEWNGSDVEPLALFQLWIETNNPNAEPRYDQKTFTFPNNVLVPVASGLGDTGAMPIYQNARVMVGTHTEGSTDMYQLGAERGLFVLVIEGTFIVGGVELGRRDAVEVMDVETVEFSTTTGGRLLVVEVGV